VMETVKVTAIVKVPDGVSTTFVKLQNLSFNLPVKLQFTRMLTSQDGQPLLRVSKTSLTSNSLLVEPRMIKLQPSKLKVKTA